ncbi:hypothetical protein-putative transmembrane protein [hydrothermal vent metagenome]|uniref:Uncharacterized protein n=1 Tax=hydrothermal vent metagenome TaxID=652676 RepID=A0A3B1DZ57_9ZZZZ
MDGVLPFYQVEAATWFYLSFLLTVTVFFRFSRFWSLRNLDLALLLSISPGLLFVRQGSAIGYAWLFAVSGLFLVRLFSDSYFCRRPRVEQNLNSYGLIFLCIVTFIFLMMKVVQLDVDAQTAQTLSKANQLVNREDDTANRSPEIKQLESGPAASVLAVPASGMAQAITNAQKTSANNSRSVLIVAAKILTIASHLAVVLALIWVGRYHFNDPHSGIAMATLYLLIPGTAYDVTKVNHVLPAALILWAFAAYRKPIIAGGLMGFACGTLFFPIFLLPLWMTFYGRKEALRFGAALIVVGAVLAGSLTLTSIDAEAFRQQLGGAIDWSVVSFKTDIANGFWTTYEDAYRIPVFVLFLLMLVILSVFPRKKNLEHLIANSTAIVVGTQFWYPQAGGVYLLWYLPLLLVVMFRPRLQQMSPLRKIEISASINDKQPANDKEQKSSATHSVSHSFFW